MGSINNSEGTENRFAIFRAEGFHLFNDPVNLEIKITEAGNDVYFQFRNEESRLDGFGNHFFKFLTESFNIFRCQRHAGCSEMSPITYQPFPARMQRFV